MPSPLPSRGKCPLTGKVTDSVGRTPAASLLGLFLQAASSASWRVSLAGEPGEPRGSWLIGTGVPYLPEHQTHLARFLSTWFPRRLPLEILNLQGSTHSDGCAFARQCTSGWGRARGTTFGRGLGGGSPQRLRQPRATGRSGEQHPQWAGCPGNLTLLGGHFLLFVILFNLYFIEK